MKKYLLILVVVVSLGFMACTKSMQDYKPVELMKVTDTEKVELKKDLSSDEQDLIRKCVKRYGPLRFVMLDVTIGELIEEQRKLDIK